MGGLRLAYDHDILCAGCRDCDRSSWITKRLSIVVKHTHRIWLAASWCAGYMFGGSVQGIFTSRRRWRRRSSKCSHGDVALILELSTGFRVAADSPCNVPDCAWNAYRVPIFYRQCRNARIAAASFPRSFVVMAFGRGPSIGSGKRGRYLRAYIAPSLANGYEPPFEVKPKSNRFCF